MKKHEDLKAKTLSKKVLRDNWYSRFKSSPRPKTSVNIREDLKGAVLKRLIDVCGAHSISLAADVAFCDWMERTSTGVYSSTDLGRGPLPYVVKSPTLSEPYATEVDATEHALILKLLRILRDGKQANVIKQIIEPLAGNLEAPEVSRATQTHDKRRSEEPTAARRRTSGDKKPSAG